MKDLNKFLDKVVKHKDLYLKSKSPVDRLEITLAIAKCTEVILYDLANRLEGLNFEYSLEEIESARSVLANTAAAISTKKFFIPSNGTVH